MTSERGSGAGAPYQFHDGTALPASVQLFARRDAQAESFRSISINNPTDAIVTVQTGARSFSVLANSIVTQPFAPSRTVSIMIAPGPSGSPLHGDIFIVAINEFQAASSTTIVTAGGAYVGP